MPWTNFWLITFKFCIDISYNRLATLKFQAALLMTMSPRVFSLQLLLQLHALFIPPSLPGSILGKLLNHIFSLPGGCIVLLFFFQWNCINSCCWIFDMKFFEPSSLTFQSCAVYIYFLLLINCMMWGAAISHYG